MGWLLWVDDACMSLNCGKGSLLSQNALYVSFKAENMLPMMKGNAS